ncbi:MAG: hypothetical protein WC399_02315 [Bacilli bacterium]|jgi:ABC-type transport system involved in multi-copper enzyme maturation permease subunit
MVRLLRLEFRRLFKDKAFFAIFIIIAIIALLQILVASNSYYEDPFGHVYWLMPLRDIITTSFQISSTPFILIGIFISLFIAKDIAQGTIRNKLIAGYSKLEVYWSTLIIASTIAFFGMVLYQGLIMAFVWKIPFQTEAFAVNELENFMVFWAVGYLLILMTTSITTFISMMVKNMAGAIILTIAFLAFTLVLALLIQSLLEYLLIYQRYDLFLDAQGAQDALDALHSVLDYFFIFQLEKYSQTLFNYTEIPNYYSTEGGLYLYKVLGTNAALLALVNVGGAYWFRKTDLK